jgi:hypothetical protein
MTWMSQSPLLQLDGIELLLTLDFIDRGDSTEMRLTHEGLPVASKGPCDAGWTAMFAILMRIFPVDNAKVRSHREHNEDIHPPGFPQRACGAHDRESA